MKPSQKLPLAFGDSTVPSPALRLMYRTRSTGKRKAPARPLVSKLRTEMENAQAGYKQAFEAYKEAGNDPIAGNKAAKGKDREAANTLNELRTALSKSEAAADDEWETF